MKSSTTALLLLTAAFAADLAPPAASDPLLTEAEIAKAAAMIEACLARESQIAKGKAGCIGLIKRPCDDAITAGGEAAHATCSDNETAAWNVLLNKVWGQLSNVLSTERFAALKKVQKLWLAYRDAKCAFLNDHESPGAWGLMLSADCRLDETSRRTTELRHILADATERAP